MKPASAKAKGRKAENEIVAYLQENGYPEAERRRLSGVQDKGDVAGVRDVCIEVKNQKTHELANWLDQLFREMEHAKATWGAVMFPRIRKGVGGWYALTTVAQYVALVRLLHETKQQLSYVQQQLEDKSK